VALTLAAVLAMRMAKPTWIPPNISMRVPLEIWIVPEYMALSFVCLCLLAMLVAAIPARRAARLPIIDSLGHV
jgi:putative ABC transport system permease protein